MPSFVWVNCNGRDYFKFATKYLNEIKMGYEFAGSEKGHKMKSEFFL